MASNIEHEYDSDNSDAEFVPDYNMVDLSDFRLTKGGELAGGSWEFTIEHCHDENISLQFALPHFKVGDKIEIEETSKNGFCRMKLDPSESKHLNFQKWIMNVETWIVTQLINNYNDWFGHLYEKGGPFEGRQRPPPNVIKDMYHPMIDEEGLFCSRVHIRKGEYELQLMTKDEEKIKNIADVKNCNVVPLVELKGVFMKPRGYNPDVVLRGIVMINNDDEADEVVEKTDFKLFHTEDDEEQYAYYDYATEDDDTVVSEGEGFTDDEEEEAEEEAEEEVEKEVGTEDVADGTSVSEKCDEETLRKLLERQEITKKQALEAEDEYKRYVHMGR